ncbi:MAG: sigma-70 family RNA polymerase sigma factor [Balneolaceae bacterium]
MGNKGDPHCEREWILRLKRDDRSAFREVYDHYHKLFYVIAYRYLNREDLAKDAVQDLFVTLWTHRNGLNESKSIGGYLRIVLRNQILNQIRDRKRETLSSSDGSLAWVAGNEDTDRTIHHREVKELYNQGLKQLPERRRTVVELKASGMTNDDIARHLLISVNTVKVHYYHGSRFIREFIHRYRDVISTLFVSFGSALL